jgi:peptide methionine sulfoxide reductase msrA/msrB
MVKRFKAGRWSIGFLLFLLAGCASTADGRGAPASVGDGLARKQRFVKPPDAELRQRLTPIQYHVTQEDGTEPPYRNEYWNHHEAGLYVDIVTGEPLFVSLDKYDSHTGWPSFTRPVAPEHVVERPDHSQGYLRREVRSAAGSSHLGHIFEDGPKPAGLRYCINSAALRFIPLAELATQGYGDYRSRFGGLR